MSDKWILLRRVSLCLGGMGEVIELTGSLIVSHACIPARKFQCNLYDDHTKLTRVFTVLPAVTSYKNVSEFNCNV
jgi:hypothetical protein